MNEQTGLPEPYEVKFPVPYLNHRVNSEASWVTSMLQVNAACRGIFGTKRKKASGIENIAMEYQYWIDRRRLDSLPSTCAVLAQCSHLREAELGTPGKLNHPNERQR